MRFDQLDGAFNSALFVRARGEPEVLRVDALSVGSQRDTCTWRRHTLHADKNP
jgi:hypothetical protein